MATEETKPEAMVAKAINDCMAEMSHLRAKFIVGSLFQIYSDGWFQLFYVAHESFL
jgi:hypothetical protein